MKKDDEGVIVRPGDKIVRIGSGDPRTVITWDEFEKSRPHSTLLRDKGRIPTHDASGIGGVRTGLFENYTISGQPVTGYDPTPRGENQPKAGTWLLDAALAATATETTPTVDEPTRDDDGMVRGWDGRKVWL